MGIIIIGSLIVVGFGVVIFLLSQKAKPSQNLEVENATLIEKLNNMIENEKELKYTLDQQKDELEFARQSHAKDQAMIATLQTQLEERQKSEEKLKTEFSNLAREILDQNSKKLQEESAKGLSGLLDPMKIQIADFKKKVEDVYDKEAKDRSALQQELKMLKELNLKMSSDANNLTNALKGQSKQQGVWGEMVLEKVLESSGLREGFEYDREVSLKDGDEKRFRPDVIVNLPDKRHIIIDAKTSLTAYNAYMSAENEEEKKLHIKSHLLSIKEHIRGLADKKYEDLEQINSLDFIFMFVPIEGALMLALENDPALYDEAFKKKIILVSPTTLLVALRAVENTWRYEKQAQSITDVSKRAEQLYTKFTDFVGDLEKVGTHLHRAQGSYDDAFGKLKSGKGNLIRQATQLKEVSNIKPKKELDQALLDEASM